MRRNAQQWSSSRWQKNTAMIPMSSHEPAAEESRGQASLLAMYRLNGTPAKLLGNVEAPQSH
jgi:hypothetical protein